MNFMEAVKLMKEGKKVRRKDSGMIHHLNDDDDIVWVSQYKDVTRYIISCGDVEATDWEIYEEEDNWNLVDKEVIQFSGALMHTKGDAYAKGKGLIPTKDIKTFIQKVKGDFQTRKYEPKIDSDIINEIIDKRAGDL